MSIGRFFCGIGVLIWDPNSNRYLILRRSEQKDFAPGLWECVTGRVDQGEGFEEAAHREVGEELGLSVQLLQILGTTHFYRGEQRAEYELIGVVYLGSIEPDMPITLSPEHSESRWVTAGEADAVLAKEVGSEGWLARVIARAESLRPALTPSLLHYNRTNGFELDP